MFASSCAASFASAEPIAAELGRYSPTAAQLAADTRPDEAAPVAGGNAWRATGDVAGAARTPARAGLSGEAAATPTGSPAGAGAPASGGQQGQPASQPPVAAKPAPAHSAPPPSTGTVPDVVGTTLSSAAAALQARGFHNLPYVYGCYGSPQINDVVSQLPGSGTSYGKTQPVSLKLQADNC